MKLSLKGNDVKYSEFVMSVNNFGLNCTLEYRIDGGDENNRGGMEMVQYSN